MQEIIKGNQLIADFMGYDLNDSGQYLIGCREPQFINSNHNEWCSTTSITYDYTKKEDCEKVVKVGEFYWDISPNKLCYACSWDWLMPVVNKIFHKGWVTVFYGNRCNINDIESFTGREYNDLPIFENFSESPEQLINAVWKSIVGFIQWYNGQNE